MRDVTTISVPQACLRTGQSYNQLMRKIFRRELEGWQDEHGRWRVSAEQVEQLANQLPRSPEAALGVVRPAKQPAIAPPTAETPR